jgi:hypothetical protein
VEEYGASRNSIRTKQYSKTTWVPWEKMGSECFHIQFLKGLGFNKGLKKNCGRRKKSADEYKLGL